MRLSGRLARWGLLVAVAGCSSPETVADSCGPRSLLYRSSAVTLGYRLLAEHPHDPEAFTQGLVFDDGELFESTGLEGASTLRRVALESGEVLQQVPLDDSLFGEGLALWRDALIQLTWKAGRALVYDRSSLQVVDEKGYATEGWGLTHDGERLILSDGTSMLSFLDPETLSVERVVIVRDGDRQVTRLNELEWINGEIWANVWLTERIARIDPTSGRVLGWVALDGLGASVGAGEGDDVLNGIAFDAEGCRLFVTGKRWPSLLEIAVE